MLAVVSDTHRTTGHGLEGRALEAIREADVVCHAGDFNAPAVYEAFLAEATRLEAVHGNNDNPDLRDRLPAQRTFDHAGVRIVVVHGHEHSDTALSLLARQEGADLLVVGHSHRPGVAVEDEYVLLNPGSHAQPRQFRAAHAEIEVEAGEIEGRLVGDDGNVFERFVSG